MNYQIGPWVFSPKHCVIESEGLSRELEPLLFKLLEYFVANTDRIITRQELIDNVWQVSFVDDNAINRAISDLRKQMNHPDSEITFIKTHYRKGYSLAVAALECTDTQNEAQKAVAFTPNRVATFKIIKSFRDRKILLITTLLVIIILLGWQLSQFIANQAEKTDGTNIQPQFASDLAQYSFSKTPETWQLGREAYQAVSPDKLLFVYTNFYDSSSRVYVKELGASLQTEVVYKDYQLTSLSWQPGSRVLLTEMLNRERKECFYAAFDASQFPEIRFSNIVKSCGIEANGIAQLNAAGTGMYYVDKDINGAGHELRYFDILTRDDRLTLASYQIPLGVQRFALSPNGEKIIYKRDEQGQSSRFFVHDIRSREDTKLLEFDDYFDAISLDWIDDTWVLLSSTEALTKVNIVTLEKELIEFPQSYLYSKISVINHNQILGSERNGLVHYITVEEQLYDSQPSKLDYTSDSQNYFPTFVGSRLFFASTRSGGAQYWREENGILQQVSQFNNSPPDILYPPAGALDGSTMVFRNNQRLQLLDLTNGVARNLTGVDVNFVNSYELTEDKTKLYLSYTNNQVVQLWEYDLITDAAKPALDESIYHVIKDGDGDIYYIQDNGLIGLTKDFQLTLPFDAKYCICAMTMSKNYFYALSDKKTAYRIHLKTGDVDIRSFKEAITGITVSPDDDTVILSKTKQRDTQILRLAWQLQ